MNFHPNVANWSARHPEPIRTFLRRTACTARRWFILFSAGIFLLMASIGRTADPVSKEHQIKAVFLYRFSQYVEWPAETFADKESPIVIGIVGPNPFGDALEKAVSNRKDRGHSYLIKQITSLDQAKSVQILFFSHNNHSSEKILAGLKSLPVLTVGESENFLGGGGIIRFVHAGDKVHFEINMAAAEESNLKISSHLQKLGQPVKR